MAGLTTQDVLARAGRSGWQVVSVQPEMRKNPLTAADWEVQHAGEDYPAEVPTGKYLIQVRPPSGQGAAQEITVSPLPELTGDYSPDRAIGVITKYGGDPTTQPMWSTDITAPKEAPAREPASQLTAVSAPSSEQYLLVRDPQTGAMSAQVNPNYRPEAKPRATVQTTSGVYERQDDGSYQLVLPAAKAPRIVGGTASTDKQLIVEDSQGNRSYIANPNYVAPRPTVIGTNTTDRYIVQQNPDGTTSQIENPNYVAPKPVAVGGGGTADQYITFVNPDGTLSKQTNPNYVAPKPTVLTADTVAPFIVTMNPDGTLGQAPNPNQLTVGDAMKGLLAQVGVQIGPGDQGMSLDEGKALLTSAYQIYDAQTQRMQATNQGAQIGAGLLQNRASQVAGQENQLLSLAGNKNFGLGLTGPLPANLWAGVHNEIMGNVTQAGGGQNTYDLAAALVHAADPSLAGTPAGAGHTAVVQQMLDAQRPPAAAAAPPQTSFQAPTTTIAPDGTVTIAHAPQSQTSFEPPGTPRGGTDWLFGSPASPIATPANTPGGS